MDIELERKYEGPKVNFKFGGRSYQALTYAKMKYIAFSAEELKICLAGAFNSVAEASKALRVLERNGCVRVFCEGKWVITPKGNEVIFYIGQARKAPCFRYGMG